MIELEPIGANAEQIKYWNETAGPKWVALQPAIDAQIGPLGRRAMDRGAIAPGERVVDIGCGCGSATLDLSRRVGPEGCVTGVDVSTRMIERAREVARAAGLANIRFQNTDAQTQQFSSGSVDLLYSRFGVMFFADPQRAFTNLRSALRPGGRLAFVCWQSLQQNPWMLVPMKAAAEHVAFPPPPGPEAPGPFSFADADRVRGILERSGFADVVIEDARGTLVVGGSGNLDQAVEFILQMGPTGAALREVDGEARRRVAISVREALAPFHTGDGVRMDAAAWIVTGRRPL